MPPPRRVFAVYCSGHGLGHVVRVIEWVRELLRRNDVWVVGSKGIAAWVLREAPVGLAPGHGELHFRERVLDVGVLQHDACTIAPRRTLDAYLSFLPQRAALLEEEVAWLAAVGASAVAVDVVPLALVAARRLNLPSAVVTNFTWDAIYAQYVEGAEDRAIVLGLAREYGAATALLRLPGFVPMPAFPSGRTADVPLVVRRPRRGAAEVRAAFGVPEGHRLVLCTFGGHDAASLMVRMRGGG